MDEDYFGLGGDYSALTEDDIAPFNNTMAQVINSTGQATVTPKTSGLANLFNSLVVAPSGTGGTGSTVGNILNYFSRSLVQKPQTQQQQLTQQGVLRVINSNSGTSMFSNPLVWVAIVAVIGLVLFVALRKR